MRKKNMARIMTAAAVLACCAATVPVYAAGSTSVTDQTGDPKAAVDLSAQINPTYTIVIPQEAGIGFHDLEHTISVKYAKGNLEPGAAVRVTTSDRTVLRHDKAGGTPAADEQIVFSVSAETSGSGTKSVVFPEGTAPETLKNFTLKTTSAEWDDAKSGTYSGEMVFTIAYDDGTGN